MNAHKLILIGALVSIAVFLGSGYLIYQHSSPNVLPTNNVPPKPLTIPKEITPPEPVSDSEDVKSCTVDEDCIIVKNNQDCCHCPTSINQAYLDRWNQMAVDCPDEIEILCRCAPANSAACINNQCKPRVGSAISYLSCPEIEQAIGVEHSKVNYHCEKNSDCIKVDTGGCGDCVNKNNDIDTLDNLYGLSNIGEQKGCLPQFECQGFNCNKCENNQCVPDYVE